MIDLSGLTVTADAIQTQVANANYLIGQGAHFHFSCKGNQKTLLEDVAYEFESTTRVADFVERNGKKHGRIECRSIWVSDKLNDYVEFPHVKQAFKVERKVSFPGSDNPDTLEVVYGITSLSKDEASAEQILEHDRGHWRVETAHNMLDNRATFDEDACLIRSKHGPENMACFRRLGLTLLLFRKKQNKQSIQEQMMRLLRQPRRALEYLKLTGNTKKRTKPASTALPLLKLAA